MASNTKDVIKTPKRTQLVIIGGFLGAGKTTLLGATTRLLHDKGKKVGLITNDQAQGLVDTHILSADGTMVEEVAGSCFCCNFDGLMEAALYLGDTAGCDTIIAEPVGSCTDLSATLMQPLKAYYGRYFDLTPLSVLVDPFRMLETLEDESGTRAGAGYIYLKQLEEADYLVINKTDLLSAGERKALEILLEDKFAGYKVYWLSALNGDGIDQWLDAVTYETQVGTRIAEVDYDLYAEGEALMGWYNATFVIHHAQSWLIPWAEFSLEFIELLQGVFRYDRITVGHLKTFLQDGHSYLQANLTGEDKEVSLRGTPFSSPSARLIVNIRAETAPEMLNVIVEDIIAVYAKQDIQFECLELRHLSPGRPVPTHRMEQVV